MLLSMFHRHIRERVAEFNVPAPVSLPSLEDLVNSGQGKASWFVVPGMYGGFRYKLGGTKKRPLIDVESWSRVIQGSGARYTVSGDAIVLIEEGFV